LRFTTPKPKEVLIKALQKYNYLHDLGEYLIMMKHALARPEKFSMYWKETVTARWNNEHTE
jgi:hypothetical protein